MRPMIKTHHSFWLLSKDGDQDASRSCGSTMGCILNGRKMSGDPWAEYAPVNPGGFTPTTVMGVAFTRMTFPITPDERPKRFAQSLSLIVTTGPLPASPSSDS